MADNCFHAEAVRLLALPAAERDAELAKTPERIRLALEMEMHSIRTTSSAVDRSPETLMTVSTVRPVTAYEAFAYIQSLSVSHDETALTLQARMLEDRAVETRRVRDDLLGLPIDNFVNELIRVFWICRWETDQLHKADRGALLMAHPRPAV